MPAAEGASVLDAPCRRAFLGGAIAKFLRGHPLPAQDLSNRAPQGQPSVLATSGGAAVVIGEPPRSEHLEAVWPEVAIEMMGSPAYMAPEQITDFETIDARADVWSLGAILYELLTNALIHDETSIGVLLAKVRYCPVASARVRRPDLPEALDRLILRCLERDRNCRVQDVCELAEGLLPFAGERSRASNSRSDMT